MDILTLLLVISAVCAIIYFWPSIPAPFNWVIAVVVVIFSLFIIASRLGVPLHL